MEAETKYKKFQINKNIPYILYGIKIFEAKLNTQILNLFFYNKIIKLQI